MERAVKSPPASAGVNAVECLSIFYLCSAIMLYSFQDVLMKLLSATYPVHELVFVRSLVALPILLAIVHFDSGFASLKVANTRLHILRALTMFIAYLSYYLALAAVPLTTAVALFFTSPLLITALAIPILGEKPKRKHVIGVLLGLTGMLFILRPGAGGFEPASLLALVAALAYAFSQLLAKKLGVADSASVMAFYSTGVFLYMGAGLGLLFSVLDMGAQAWPSARFLTRAWQMPGGLELVMMLVTGVISGLGIYLLTQAYRQGSPQIIAPFEYTGLIWASLLSFAFWGLIPGTFTAIGAGLIVAGGIVVMRAGRDPSQRLPIARRGLFRSRWGP